MRVALHHTSDIGLRAGRILLAERDLQRLGVLGRRTNDPDPRLRSIESVDGYDLVVTDDPEPESIVAQAAAAGIHCVVWADGDGLADHDGLLKATLLRGANLSTGLALSLGAHETEILPEATTELVAWTEPGRALRSGVPISFPDPVGPRWGRIRSDERGVRRVAVPLDGEWAAILARISDGATTRTVGVADLASHLEALALAAGVLAVSTGAYRTGTALPADRAADYLFAALGAGLDVASFTEAG